MSDTPQVKYLKDYQVSDFLLEAIDLAFDIEPEHARVKTVMRLRRNPESSNAQAPLFLNGEKMTLQSVMLDGKALTDQQYKIDDVSLTIADVPDSFVLETIVEINPRANTALIGLYESRGNFCTQCESHGFRRITYSLDRPDVLTHITTKITADKKQYPNLLSNGNLMDQGDLDGGRHWVQWHDPSLKPCYLFALVAGDFDSIEDTFKTMSGRDVALHIYVEKGKQDQAPHAMESLKKSMRWDEETFGREYDLDIYMIVSVSDFNFGAMENKGLNIFNSKYILARQDTATDSDYVFIEAVIGHEYFHNWSGNRITCRDWFQITLKEGLTVLRDQLFTADMTSPVVKRIQDVRTIRTAQFAQDAGPMAHPIQPDSYIEMNNFYTVTVYNKGAEVIRMIRTMLGRDVFRQAMDLYFDRHDGQAVTADDFVTAMEDGSGVDLTQFRRWYKQAGTPELDITDEYDVDQKMYTLTVKQSCPATPGQATKENFHIPLAIGLLDSEGRDMKLQLESDKEAVNPTKILNVTEAEQIFRFVNVQEEPLPSLLRNFSAPVRCHFDYEEQDLVFLLAHDSDDFNRWDAGQSLFIDNLFDMIDAYQNKGEMEVSMAFIGALDAALQDDNLDNAFKAELLCFPSESYFIEEMEEVDVVAIHAAREQMKKMIAKHLHVTLLELYDENEGDSTFSIDVEAMGKRRIKNICLGYLTLLDKEEINQLCLTQYQETNNMTDSMGAISALIDTNSPVREQVLASFFEKWKEEDLVMDKWFTIQALSTRSDTMDKVRELRQHPLFDIKNPNRARSLLGAFSASNPSVFHTEGGEAYAFLTDQILEIDQFNPQLAARFMEPLIHWKRFDAKRQELMKTELQRLINTKGISKDIYEIVSKSL